METPASASHLGSVFIARLRKALSRLLLSRRFAFALAAGAVISGAMTFGLFSGVATGAGTQDTQKVVLLLIIDLVILLMLSAIIAHRIVAMWVQRRRGMAGSALHVRLVVMFSALAVTPAILVAVFATLFLNFGINAWFSDKVRTAVDTSAKVASAYFDEHVYNIRASILAMANDLNSNAATLSLNPTLMTSTLTNQSSLRGLTEATILGINGEILARSRYSMMSLGDIPSYALERADNGELVILTAPKTDEVRALVKLKRYVGTYLLVGRFVDARVLQNMKSVREAVQSYQILEKRRGSIQITFVAIFAVVALLLLLAAIWIGMAIANQLVRPVSNLIDAAQRVSAGDLSQRVPVDDTIGEMGVLSKAFNEMTGKLEVQQDGLLQMNRTLDERRRFTETVLGGVSAGVIGLDAQGRVNLPNRSANLLLGKDFSTAIGRDLAELVPEMAGVLAVAMDRPDRVARAEVTLKGDDAMARILMVNVTAEHLDDGDVIGFVVTFDDITELQSAQRKAAWAGVARRIAHEIKNPLTPIQLAAERLKRKYLKQIKDDPETFLTCTETIIRQVEDLGRMVDEFSSFSRLPQAVLKPENMSNLCRQAVFLEKNRGGNVTLESDLPPGPVILNCDAQQISRALTNILKNASESIEEKHRRTADGTNEGWIGLSLKQKDTPLGTRTIIQVDDNGLGMPNTDKTRLTEPYVTTRDRGTGLGLAIVKKIMEDHGGDLILENREKGGARVILSFPPENAQWASWKEDAQKDIAPNTSKLLNNA